MARVRNKAYSAAALSKEFEVVREEVPRPRFSESALYPPCSIRMLSVHHIELIEQLVSHTVHLMERFLEAIEVGNAQIPL